MAQVPIPLTTLSTGSSAQAAGTFVGRRSPMVCPLAKLGRTSPTIDRPRYHGSTPVDVGYRRSPLDPSVYSYVRGTPSPLEPSIYIHRSPTRAPDSLCYRNSPFKEGSQQYRKQKTFGNADPNIGETSFRSFPGLMNDSFYHNGSPSNGNFNSLRSSLEVRHKEMPSSLRLPATASETTSTFLQRLGGKTSSENSKNNSGVGDSSMFNQQCLINQGHMQADQVRCSSALRRTSSPKVDHLFLYQTTDVDANYKMGRCSPSLDQGYHTLVSPSPGPSTPGSWTDYNPLSPSATSTKGKKFSTSKSSSCAFDKLPDEIIVKIFSWLDSSDLCICARVCKRWESIAWEPQLWKIIKLSGENLCGDKAVRGVLRRLCGQGTTGACPAVEKVLLSDGAKITDKGLTQLSRRCTELTHLQLHGCSAVTNNAIFELATKCTNLQHLDLTGCSRISCLSVTPGPEPPSRLLLQYLDLTDCSAVDDGGLKVIVKNCPQLVYLYLRRCVQITDAGIKFIPSFCSMLRELSVSDCNRVTDFGLHELAKLGATLRYLSVAKCDRVSDAGLKVIARRCYKLRYLNARGCEAVSDDAITVLARSCPRLRALDIGKCDVSDAGLRALAECCPNLKKLSLRNCDLVTDRGVQCIAYYCRGLQQLNIQDCEISIDGYRAVKKYCKRCVIEHTNPGFF